MADTDLCTICHRPEAEHIERGFQHKFIGPGQDSALFARTDQRTDDASPKPAGAQGRIRMPSSADPILRMALIRKGIITPEDLDAVEAELRATGVAGYEPPETLDQS